MSYELTKRLLQFERNAMAKQAILAFVEAVNTMAERNMLKTGKLEGAHKAAMDHICKELGWWEQ